MNLRLALHFAYLAPSMDNSTLNMAFTFEDILGNQSLKKELAKLIQRGQMPHTSIIHGLEGSAKLRIALAAARMLLCQNKEESAVCGDCPSCQKTEQLAHPDLHFCFPIIGSEQTSDDFLAAWRSTVLQHPEIALYDWLEQGGFSTTSKNLKGNISTKNIRHALNKLQLKSYEGGSKILLLWMPELMGKEGNRALKIFEEPPPDTYIIMVGERLQALLPTILSRTQRFKVDKYKAEEVVQLLTRRGIDSNQAQAVATTADGNMNAAIRISEGLGEEEEKWTLKYWVEVVGKGDAQALYKMADRFLQLNIEQRQYFLKHCITSVDQATKLKRTTTETSPSRPKETEFIRNFANALDIQQMYGLIASMDKAIYYVQRNANAKILFIALSYMLEQYFKKTAVHSTA